MVVVTLSVALEAMRSYGFTPLLGALAWGRLELVPQLVNKGADVNVAAADGSTPLLIASHQPDAQLVGFLIEHGADVERDKDGITPLHVACERGHAEVAKVLVRGGAKAHRAMPSGKTPLALARGRGDEALVQFLESS